MMLLAALALFGQIQGSTVRQDILLNLDGSQPRLMIRQPQDPLGQPKKGPKTFGENKIQFDFEWVTWGFARLGETEQHDLRFRVYSQERKADNDTAQRVTRMLMRLWDLNKQRLNIDHAPRNPDGYQLVNVYITWGGKAGGEQFTSADVEAGKRVSANNIYLYDLASFTDPIEMAREVAHEYGHATLPAIGTYTAPEGWANGYLGEKLYMSWIRDILANKQLAPDDFLDVQQDQLNSWVAANVDPLVAAAATEPPTMGELADRSKKGMDAYLGLALYMSQILPEKVFARSLRLTGSQNARDYLSAISLAVEEPAEVPIKVPASLKGKEIWLPTGKGRVVGAKVLAIEGGWTKVQPGTEAITIKPRS